MKLDLLRLGIFLCLACCGIMSHADLVHQYTFNDGTANDFEGNADGTLIGTASVGGLGKLNLTGGGAGNSYLDLPNGIASAAAAGGTSGAFSFEVWAEATANVNWASLVSLGGADGQEDTNDGPTKDYIQLIPQNEVNGNIRATTHAIDVAEEGFVDYSAPLSEAALQHLVVVIDQTGGLPGTVDLYVEGSHVGQADVAAGLDFTSMVDNNNWLGRSQWGDPSFNGSYDEFRMYDHPLSAAEVTNSFNNGPVPPPSIPLTPTLTVDRNTGSMILQGGQTANQVVGYSIQSAFGTLDQAGWTPITDNKDAPSPGDGMFDSNDHWTILTAPGVHTDFSEFEFDGGDGGELGVGEFLSLSSSGGWIKSTVEDLEMELKLDNGTTVAVEVVYTGNGGEGYVRSDLNFDGEIDELDWPLFRDNAELDLSALSLAEAYARGDLDGDGDNDYEDFRLFQADFDAAAGFEGALAALIAVPEPGTAVLLIGLVAVGWAAPRGCRSLTTARLS